MTLELTLTAPDNFKLPAVVPETASNTPTSEYEQALDLAKEAIKWPPERLADLLVRTRGEGRDEGARNVILELDETFGVPRK